MAAGGSEGTMAIFAMVPFGYRVEGNAIAGRDHSFQPNTPDPLYRRGDDAFEGWNGRAVVALGETLPAR